MDIILGARETERVFPHVVLTIGSFDGIHLGHRLIIETVVRTARQAAGTPAVLTMKPHPREFFSPQHAPNLLTSEKKKYALLEEAGVGVVYVLKFDQETANLAPREFIKQVVHDRCHAKAVIVGHDCRFGKGATGDFSTLRNLGPEFGFSTEEIPPLFIDGERVSSTLIREKILQGDLEAAERFLGRKYSIMGEVVRGRGLGVQLGFPTANIKPHHSAVPAQGVYIAEVLLDGYRGPAAVNIGIAPTLRHEDLTIEAHVLDFEGDLAGNEIEIIFHKRIRPEKKFPSVDALKEQIARDVGDTRKWFET